MSSRTEGARRRYLAAYRALVDRYGHEGAEEAFVGLSGPGVWSASTDEQAELLAQRAEALLAHCDRVDALNLRRRDLAELVDADQRLPLLQPWALHAFGMEIDQEEALTEQRWRAARKEMEFLDQRAKAATHKRR